MAVKKKTNSASKTAARRPSPARPSKKKQPRPAKSERRRAKPAAARPKKPARVSAAKPVAKAPPPPPRRSAAAPARVAPPAAGPRKTPFSAKQLEYFRKLLLDQRDQIVDGINFLASENLNSQREASGDLSNYGMHMADQGTDNFDREFALNMVSNDQDLLYEIDEALHRLDNGTYGICEMTGQPIEIERLKAMPHARYCLAAQAEVERGRKRYRQFGPSGLSGAIEP